MVTLAETVIYIHDKNTFAQFIPVKIGSQFFCDPFFYLLHEWKMGRKNLQLTFFTDKQYICQSFLGYIMSTAEILLVPREVFYRTTYVHDEYLSFLLYF